MKLNRRFYDSTINFRDISKERLVLGIAIGFVSAFAIYGFSYLLRESLRLMSYGFGHLPNILSESERHIYNWFFAAISLILGNSVTISFIFSGIQGGFGSRNLKKRRVVNNQTAFNSFFLFWFAKMCFIIGLLSMGFTDFNFLPSYTIPIIFLVLVLYFETWKTLVLVLGKRKYKIMLIHFLVMFILSFGLSKIDFVNYKLIDKSQLQYKPLVDLPESKFTNVTYFDNFSDVTLSVKEKDKLLFNYYKNDLNESYLDFSDLKLSQGYRPDLFSIRLKADGKTRMKTIKDINEQIIKAKVENVIYATLDGDDLAQRFSSAGIKLKIKEDRYFESDRLNLIPFQTEYLDVEKDFKPKDTLNIKIGKDVLMNGGLVSDIMLVQIFKKHINKNTIFKYEYSLDIEYKDYLKILSAHLSAIDLLKKENYKVELEWDDFKYKNKKEFLKDQQRLYDLFPFRMIEKIN